MKKTYRQARKMREGEGEGGEGRRKVRGRKKKQVKEIAVKEMRGRNAVEGRNEEIVMSRKEFSRGRKKRVERGDSYAWRKGGGVRKRREECHEWKEGENVLKEDKTCRGEEGEEEDYSKVSGRRREGEKEVIMKRMEEVSFGNRQGHYREKVSCGEERERGRGKGREGKCWWEEEREEREPS